jgi:hypothetical protein
VCKILAAHEIKPHKIRYYAERRDPEFEPKMAEVLCVYREVEMRRTAAAERDDTGETASPMMRNPVFRRSAIPRLISRRFPASTPPRSATTSTSATAR